MSFKWIKRRTNQQPEQFVPFIFCFFYSSSALFECLLEMWFPCKWNGSHRVWNDDNFVFFFVVLFDEIKLNEQNDAKWSDWAEWRCTVNDNHQQLYRWARANNVSSKIHTLSYLYRYPFRFILFNIIMSLWGFFPLAPFCPLFVPCSHAPRMFERVNICIKRK